MKNFKPMLCPNDQVDLSSIKYPMLASVKLDGVRAIFINGELFSRSLKLLPNSNLDTMFKDIKKYSKDNNVIFDGELYCKSVTFNELSGIIRSDNQELPKDLRFCCFDVLDANNKKFIERYVQYHSIELPNFIGCKQTPVKNEKDVNTYFELALSEGFEGLILRNPDSYYKFGRVTAKSNDAYKVKSFVTLDAKIIGIGQATEAREGSEKTINELGRSKTSQKLADRVLIPMASTFKVMYEGKELEVSIAMSHEEKKEIWANQSKYIGRILEYKCMETGMKDLPRHATSIRFRDDKDEDKK